MQTKLGLKTKEIKYLDLMEMCDEVDKALGFNQRACGKHFFPDAGNYTEWCDFHGKGGVDTEGKTRGASQGWYSEYTNDVALGKWNDVPYMDFWHWQIDVCVGENFGNDRFSTIYVGLDEYPMSKAKPWQREIQEKWHELYYHLSDDGVIDVWVCW